MFVHHVAVAVGQNGTVVGFEGVYVQGEHIFRGIVVAFGDPQVFALGPIRSFFPLRERAAGIGLIEQCGDALVFFRPSLQHLAAVIWGAVVH